MKAYTLGFETEAKEGLTGWGHKKVTRLWLVKEGQKVEGKTVYSVLGLHRKENGDCDGWGHLFESTSLAKTRAWMRENAAN